MAIVSNSTAFCSLGMALIAAPVAYIVGAINGVVPIDGIRCLLSVGALGGGVALIEVGKCLMAKEPGP